MDFIPYKSNETLEHKYYQIPQELFVNKKYKNKLNSDSKILYAFLLDRLSLSQKNHWIDEDNNVYLIFTREEVQEKLNLSDKTVTKSFKILMEVNLVQEKRQGLGKPNLIYVGKINHSDSENLRGINTNIINTESINPKSDEDLLLIKEKCNLNEFTKEEKTILEDVIDNLYITVNHFKILDKLNLITKTNLVQLLDILKNTPNIQNAENYLMICLYNNLGNTNITKITKKADTIKANEREYPAGSLDFLYANLDTLDDTI